MLDGVSSGDFKNEEPFMRFLKKLRKKKSSIIAQFLRRFRKKKREKPKIKTEAEIRLRRNELIEIRRNWIENGEKGISDIDAVIAEFDWILCEETKPDSEKELQKSKKQIKELEEENRKLQVAINVSRRD